MPSERFPLSPAISVLMCVYNDEQHISASVESILNQTFKDFEFIIINDGSTDGTPVILDDYARSDARIRLLHQENEGLTRALNRGLAMCRGHLVARQDSDDVSVLHRLEVQWNIFQGDPGLVLLGTDAISVDAKEHELPREIPLITDHNELLRALFCFNPFTHTSVAFVRLLALDAGGYDPKDIAAEDYGLWIRLSRFGKVSNVPEKLVYRRIRPNSISVTKLRKARLSVLRLKLRNRCWRYGVVLTVKYLLKDVAVILLPISFWRARNKALGRTE